MTEFRPLSPKNAVALAEAANVADAERLIRDHAAAGLVKSYAVVVDTVEPGGRKKSVRDAALPTELWDRMIREGCDADVWTGGTVRLAGSDLIGGAPAVNITAVGFNPGDLKRMIDRHLGRTGKAKAKAAAPLPSPAPDVADRIEATPPVQGRSGLAAIPDGAITVTIKQTMAALGLGRTTVDKLCGEGRLERVRVGGRALISVESIRALIAIGRR